MKSKVELPYLDLRLNVLITHNTHKKRAEETFRSDYYICGIVYSDNFMGPYLSSNLASKLKIMLRESPYFSGSLTHPFLMNFASLGVLKKLFQKTHTLKSTDHNRKNY